MAIVDSGTVFVTTDSTVSTATPLGSMGWEVIVRYSGDFSTILAVVPNFETISFTEELSGSGGGAITMALDDPLFSTPLPVVGASLLDKENLWEFYEDSVLRFQWLGTKVTTNDITENETPTVTIAGKGIADLLRRATVLPPSYPTVPPFYWTFTSTPSLSIWRQLLLAAQARGTIPFVTTTFTATVDSAGVAWPDSQSIQHENGGNLFDLLTGYSQLIKADWRMLPGFVVDVRQNYGVHRESAVIFHPGGAQEARTKDRDYSSVANVVVAQDVYGALSTATDATSVAYYSRREFYLDASTTTDDLSRGNLARAYVDQNKDGSIMYSISVSPSQPGRRIFVDYNVGDWVGVESDNYTVETLRVVALSASITNDGVVTPEVTLSTKAQFIEDKIQAALNAVNSSSSSSQTLLSSGVSSGAYNDATAPSTPAAPTIASSLIAFQLTHSLGKASGGTFNLESDIHHLEVHYSVTTGFTPSTSTFMGNVSANYGMIIANTPVVSTFQVPAVVAFYVKVIAVDQAGNRSAASAQATTSATLIDTAHISDLTATKITAGTISVAVLLTGSLATGVAGGTGQYLSINSIADRSTIYFSNAAGTDSAFINSVDDGTGHPMMGINSGSYTVSGVGARSRVYLANNTGIQLESIKTSGSYAIGGAVYLTALGSDIMVNSLSTGAVVAEMYLTISGAFWFRGAWQRSNADSGLTAVYADSWGSGPATDFAVSYGVTMASVLSPITTVKTTADPGSSYVSVRSATGFTHHINTSRTIELHWWGFRNS